MKKILGKVILGAAAGAAYYIYKNREVIEEKLEDEKVVHLINEVKDNSQKIINSVSEQFHDIKETVSDKIEKMDVDHKVQELKNKVVTVSDEINKQVKSVMKDTKVIKISAYNQSVENVTIPKTEVVKIKPINEPINKQDILQSSTNVETLEQVIEDKANFKDDKLENEKFEFTATIEEIEEQQDEVKVKNEIPSINTSAEEVQPILVNEEVEMSAPVVESFDSGISIDDLFKSLDENLINQTDSGDIFESINSQPESIVEIGDETKEVDDVTIVEVSEKLESQQPVVYEINNEEIVGPVIEETQESLPVVEEEAVSKIKESKSLFGGLFNKTKNPNKEYLKRYPSLDMDIIERIIGQVDDLLSNVGEVTDFKLIQTVLISEPKRIKHFKKDLDDSYAVSEMEDGSIDVSLVVTIDRELIIDALMDVLDCALYNVVQYRGWRVELI